MSNHRNRQMHRLQVDLTEYPLDGLLPKLQDWGLFRQEYTGLTLRDHLSLSVPVNKFSRATNPKYEELFQ